MWWNKQTTNKPKATKAIASWMAMLAAVLVAAPGDVRAAERHVPSPYGTIQAAIDAANDYDEVVIAPGTYTGDGNRDLYLGAKVITVRSTDPGDPNVVAATIIDCQGSSGDEHRGFEFDANSVDPNVVVAGLTITNGDRIDGGAIYSESGGPTITNCTITGNTASSWGGGIYCDGGSLTITNCTISGNTTSYYGGGIYSYRGSLTITNCTISGNTSSYYGGGIYSYRRSPTITNCTISGNTSEYGGGICCDGVTTSTITNCILWNNTATNGPEIALQYSATLTVSYCDVQGGPNDVDVAGSSTLNWGSGNIDADPLFVNPAGPDGDPNTWEDNDHHLSSSSPCIDAGDPNGDYAGQTDIDGQPRVIGPRVDMGSDEFALTLTVINGTGSGTYAQDQVVPISATVPPGTRFGQWTGDTANVADIYSASTTVVMKANTTLTATFVTLYTLTVTITGQGTVTPTGGTYPDGTKVTLTATADEGWHFVAWQNGATGTDPSVTVTMDADKIVEALFELDSSAPQPAPQDSNACCAGGGAAAPLACVWTWCAIALARGGAKRRR